MPTGTGNTNIIRLRHAHEHIRRVKKLEMPLLVQGSVGINAGEPCEKITGKREDQHIRAFRKTAYKEQDEAATHISSQQE